MNEKKIEMKSYVFPLFVPQQKPSNEFMEEILERYLNPDEVGLWFLGQNSWILKSSDGTRICIDPYLTDWCASKDTGLANEKSRLLPVFIEPEDLDVNVVILTHSHPDHCDPYTISRLSKKTQMIFVAPWQCLSILKEAGVPQEQIFLLHPLQTFVFNLIEITGMFALPTSHDDLNHIGILIKFPNQKTYYNSGDTAFSELLYHVREYRPDVASVCINGGYHNLSHWDAARVVAAIKPRVAIPAHFDMMPHNLQSPHMFKKSLWEHDRNILYKQVDYYSCFIF